MWITVEGGDGAGKSTLLEGLVQVLRQEGKRVLLTREPGGTSVGQQIRSLLLRAEMNPRTELYLFLADRIEHLHSVILPALQENIWVLCDRYNDSTIAYQGMGRGLGWEEVEKICQEATQPYEPDITFYLDIAPEEALQRISRTHDRMEGEGLSFHKRVREGFLALSQRYPKRIFVIDARLPKEEVLEVALAQIWRYHV